MNGFRNLIDALEAAPADRPFITFWSDEEERETVTFGDFRRRASVQATVLRSHGLSAGHRVVIIMPQGIPAMAVFAGAMMLGAVPAFLAYPNFKVEASKYRSGLAGVTTNIRASLVVIDEEFPDDMLGHVSLSDGTRLLRATETAVSAVSEKLAIPEIQASDLAFIQHSAGTTGLQKGVALTHTAVLLQIEHLAEALRIDGATDRVYSWLPLYHDMGLVACFLLPMVCHTHVVMQSPIDWVLHPETMLQIISEYRCTLAWMPNFAFQFVPRRAPRERWGQYDLSSVRALINCSEPVRSSSVDQFQDAFAAIGLRHNTLQSSYAMAENVFAVTQSGIDRGAGPRRIWADGKKFRSAHQVVPVADGSPGSVSFISSGQVLPGTEIRIVSDSGVIVPPSHVGEILVRSDCLFQCYYNRPDLTAGAIINGWYHSGDLGFCIADEVFVVGRKKDLLIVGGENLYPQDIEEIVAGHPSIHDGRVIALGVLNPDLGTEDIIVVAEIEHEELLADAIQIEREVRSRLTLGMGIALRTIFLKPQGWIVKSTAGKPARSATLEKLLQEHPELSPEY